MTGQNSFQRNVSRLSQDELNFKRAIIAEISRYAGNEARLTSFIDKSLIAAFNDAVNSKSINRLNILHDALAVCKATRRQATQIRQFALPYFGQLFEDTVGYDSQQNQFIILRSNNFKRNVAQCAAPQKPFSLWLMDAQAAARQVAKTKLYTNEEIGKACKALLSRLGRAENSKAESFTTMAEKLNDFIASL